MRRWRWLKLVFDTRFFRFVSRHIGGTLQNTWRLTEIPRIREFAFIALIKSVREILSITETVKVIPRRLVSVIESLSIVESITLFIKRVLRVSEVIALTEQVITYIYTTVSRAVTEILGIIESVAVVVQQVVMQIVNAVESLTLTEVVRVNTTGVPQTPWSSGTIYDHNNNVVSTDTAFLANGQTNDAYSLYHSPPNPTNPRKIELVWETPVYDIFCFNIYISVVTPGKWFIVTVYDSSNNSETYAVYPTAGSGWYSIILDYYNIYNVRRVEIVPDSSYLGAIGIAEFQPLTV